MKKLLTIFLFGTSLLTSVPAVAQVHQRYYDRDGRDWHAWNANENRAYRHWLMEERRERRYREYRHLRSAQQLDYWRWRHSHSDWR